MIHNANRLIINPAIAQCLGLSLHRAMILIKRAMGVPIIKRIPARSPPGLPQPNPGTPSQPATLKTHGDIASPKLIFPNRLSERIISSPSPIILYFPQLLHQLYFKTTSFSTSFSLFFILSGDEE